MGTNWMEDQYPELGEYARSEGRIAAGNLSGMGGKGSPSDPYTNMNGPSAVPAALPPTPKDTITMNREKMLYESIPISILDKIMPRLQGRTPWATQGRVQGGQLFNGAEILPEAFSRGTTPAVSPPSARGSGAAPNNAVPSGWDLSQRELADQGSFSFGPPNVAGDAMARANLFSGIDAQRASWEKEMTPGPRSYYDAHPDERFLDRITEEQRPYEKQIGELIEKNKSMLQGFGLPMDKKLAGTMQTQATKNIADLQERLAGMATGRAAIPTKFYEAGMQYGPGNAKNISELAQANYYNTKSELERTGLPAEMAERYARAQHLAGQAPSTVTGRQGENTVTMQYNPQNKQWESIMSGVNPKDVSPQQQLLMHTLPGVIRELVEAERNAMDENEAGYYRTQRKELMNYVLGSGPASPGKPGAPSGGGVPNVAAFKAAAKAQGSKMSDMQLEYEFNRRYGRK